jgi:hypothetical protein
MKNIKLFKEHSEEMPDGHTSNEMPAGYTPNTGKFNFDSDNKSITIDTIKSAIIEAMMDHNDEVDAEDPKFAEGINRLAEKIMSNFQDTLSYISEHYEGDIQDILSLDENY